MNLKIFLSFVIAAALAAVPVWPQPMDSPSPVLRLRQGAQTLQRRAIVSQRVLERLQAKIQKTKQEVPSAAATVAWIGSTIEKKGVLKKLKEEGALLAGAQKGLAKLGGCQGLTTDQWKPIVAADESVAQSVNNLKLVRADLQSLQKAKLGQSVLTLYIKQLNAKNPEQARALQSLLESVQSGLSGAAGSLENGLAEPGLAQVGRLSKAHIAYCESRTQPAPTVPNFVAASGGLVDSGKVEEGFKIISDAKDVRSKVKELKSLIKSTPLRTGTLGKPATGGGLFAQIFGEDIKDSILAEFGDSQAYARHVGRQLDERLAGTLANLYVQGGKGDLLVNDAGQVYDQEGRFLGTLDLDGRVVPSQQALQGYNPTFRWIAP